MTYRFIKRKLLDLYRFNIEPRIEALHAEQIYQGIFHRQCQQHGLQDLFYPVGAAASYSLMYFLARLMVELSPQDILELGSGETTVLIDRLRPAKGSHVAYDQSEFWVERVAARAPRCSVRFAPLEARTFEGTAYQGFRALASADFDLLLVDGPNGTPHASRYDCVALVAENRKPEFVVVVDDAGRPGEQETIAALAAVLTRRHIDYKLNYLAGRTTQAVLTTGAYRAASYFY